METLERLWLALHQPATWYAALTGAGVFGVPAGWAVAWWRGRTKTPKPYISKDPMPWWGPRDNYSKNERAAEVMGLRVEPGEDPPLPIDTPSELGYWCPVCKVQPDHDGGALDERLQWSEYNGFLWCAVCNFDYPSALCVRLDGPIIPQRTDGRLNSPSYRWGGRDLAVSTFLSSVQQAVARAKEPDDAD